MGQINYDEYKALGGIVRFRIGPSHAFGKGLETDLEGNTVFDLLEVMGYRRDVTINYEKHIDTLIDHQLCEDPDKGYYNHTVVQSKDEELHADSYIDQNGNSDYESLDPRIVGTIDDTVPSGTPSGDDHYLVRGSVFNTEYVASPIWNELDEMSSDQEAGGFIGMMNGSIYRAEGGNTDTQEIYNISNDDWTPDNSDNIGIVGILTAGAIAIGNYLYMGVQGAPGSFICRFDGTNFLSYHGTYPISARPSGSFSFGSSVSASDTLLYVSFGDGGFESFDPASGFVALDAVPVAPGAGSRSVCVGDYVYLTAGGSSVIFRRYKITPTVGWDTVDDLPEQCKDGASLVAVGTNSIYYCPGGGSDKLYIYDITADDWDELNPITIPLANPQQSGFYMTTNGTDIYIASGQTAQFIKYDTTIVETTRDYYDGDLIKWNELNQIWEPEVAGRPLSFTFRYDIGNSSTGNDEPIYNVPDIIEEVDASAIDIATGQEDPQVLGLYRVSVEDDLPSSPNGTGLLAEVGDIVELIMQGGEFYWRHWVRPTSFDVSLEFGPVFISSIETLSETVHLTVRDRAGQLKSSPDFNDITFTDLDPRLDRTDSLERGLKFQDISISIDSGEFEPGDCVFARYKYFAHTDQLRDRDTSTMWRTRDDIVDTEITIDFSPNGGKRSDFPYSNIHLIAHDSAVNMGAYNYIVHIGEFNSNGQLRYKFHASGEIRNAQSGEMNVIKFNETDARYLKLNLFTPQNKGFVALTVFLDDPGLEQLGVDESPEEITYVDYEKVSIVPYYHDKSSVISRNTTIVLGNEIDIKQIVANGIGRGYIPVYNNNDEELQEEYELAYFDIKYQSELVYSGILPDKNSDISQVVAITDQTIESGEIGAGFTSDIIIDRTDGQNDFTSTRFKNIVDNIAITNSVDFVYDDPPEEINEPDVDYFQDGRIVTIFRNTSLDKVVAKILDHNGDDSLVGGGVQNNFIIPSTSPSGARVKVLANDNFIVAWRGGSSGIYYTIFDSAGGSGSEEFLPGQTSATDSQNPQIDAFTTGGFVIACQTSGNSIDIVIFDENEDGVTPISPLNEISFNLADIDTSKSYKIICLNTKSFLIIYTNTPGSGGDLKIRHFNQTAIDIGGNAFASGSTIVTDDTDSYDMILLGDSTVVVCYEDNGTGEIRYRLYSDVGVLLAADFVFDTGTFNSPKLLNAPSDNNFIITYEKTAGEGYYFQYIEVFICGVNQLKFELRDEFDPSDPNHKIYKNLTEIDYLADFKLSNDGYIIITEDFTTLNDVIYIIRKEEIVIKAGETNLTNFKLATYKSLGDDFSFIWEKTGGTDQSSGMFYNQNTFNLYWRYLEDDTEQQMISGTGTLGEYTINKRTGAIRFRVDGVEDYFRPSFGENDGVNFEIFGRYKYAIRKFSNVFPQRFVKFLGARLFPKFIAYAGMRVYMDHHFAEYLPNNDDEVNIFPSNPSEEETSYDVGGGVIKMLNNKRVRDNVGDIKQDKSYSGQKISKDFSESLEYWYQEGEELGLVDDMRRLKIGFIAPKSLKLKRRRTTYEEQVGETGSYSYSFIFQES